MLFKVYVMRYFFLKLVRETGSPFATLWRRLVSEPLIAILHPRFRHIIPNPW